MKKTLVFFLFIWFAFGKLNAQKAEPSSEPNHYWMQFGPGTGNSDFSVDLSVNADFKKFYVGISYSEYIEEFLVFFSASELLQTLNLKAGKLYRYKAIYYGFNGGPGYARFLDPRKVGETGGWFNFDIYEYDQYNLFNFTAEAVIGVRMLEISSLNLSIGGNINSRSPQVYVRLGIGFGKFF